MASSAVVDSAFFREFGYVLVKGVLPPEDVARLREAVRSARDRDRAAGTLLQDSAYPNLTNPLGDLLSKPSLKAFDYVLFDERILRCVRALVGDRLVYFGDSSLQTGEGPRGFHKDNVDRTDPSGPDWRGDYDVVRFGLYLQDHSGHSGGLKVRRRSHGYVSRHRGRAINIPSERGDLVLWNLRTSHSGNNVRLKAWPGLCLPPRIETRIPRALRIPEEEERMVLFCSLGAPGAHVDRYVQYQTTQDECRKHWKHSCVTPEIRELAERKGVEIRTPIPEYGSLCPGSEQPVRR